MYDPSKPYKHKILSLIESTWESPYVTVRRGLYPVVERKISLPEVQHTDGIGTKGYFHWQQKTFKSAVLDALAMNLNDMAMVGAVPYTLQNHIVLPEDDHLAILAIVRALATECRARQIAMTGGETSIHSDMDGMDLSITVNGFIKGFLRNQCQAGDVLIGLKSNGLHSNGFTKVREVLGQEQRTEFTKPTKIYLDEILTLLSKHTVNGMMHITGGAFTKLRDILGKSDAIITQPRQLAPQPIFKELHRAGVADDEMYSTFNCGIGFVLSVPKEEVDDILSQLSRAAVIGEVVEGKGQVRITSAFSGQDIIL